MYEILGFDPMNLRTIKVCEIPGTGVMVSNQCTRDSAYHYQAKACPEVNEKRCYGGLESSEWLRFRVLDVLGSVYNPVQDLRGTNI
jgi:hypothetical protein